MTSARAKRHALLLAAAQLIGRTVLQPLQLGQIEHAGHFAFDLLAAQLLDLQPVGDVLEDGEVRKDRIALKDHRHIAAVGRQFVDVLAVQNHLAKGRKLKPGDQAQRRRLAAAGRPQQRDKLAALDVDAHVVHGAHIAAAVAAGKMLADIR